MRTCLGVGASRLPYRDRVLFFVSHFLERCGNVVSEGGEVEILATWAQRVWTAILVAIIAYIILSYKPRRQKIWRAMLLISGVIVALGIIGSGFYLLGSLLSTVRGCLIGIFVVLTLRLFNDTM
jgi:hypothetical protein